MRFTSFTGPKNPTKHGKNAKVAKLTRVCPPTGASFSGLKGGVALQVASWKLSRYRGMSQPTLLPVALQCAT